MFLDYISHTSLQLVMMGGVDGNHGQNISQSKGCSLLFCGEKEGNLMVNEKNYKSEGVYLGSLRLALKGYPNAAFYWKFHVAILTVAI